MIKVRLAKQVYLKVSSKGHLAYLYRYGMPFEFTLLSEVGRSVQPVYEAYFVAMGWSVKTVELDRAPWLQDVIEDYQSPSRSKNNQTTTRS